MKTLRLFHTADWHLGQLFHYQSRYQEHCDFLAWLLEQIKHYQPHVLCIAGDIFDVINPSAQAQKQLYQFLSDVHQHVPHVQTLMIAGNHDSGYRIEQVNPLLSKYNAKAVGVIQWKDDQIDLEHLILPIYDQSQQIIAWCVALPFLRSAEITGRAMTSSDYQSATEKIYDYLIQQAKQRQTDQQALIVMTHAHLHGADETKASERPILIGHQEAVSVDFFAEGIDYVALGHLHKPQKVKYSHIRYSGSPIPLSFSEIDYPHQVMMVEIDKRQQYIHYQPLFIPRTIALKHILCPLEELEQILLKLEQGEIDDPERRIFLEIEYTTAEPPPPDLRQKVEQWLPKNRYRLLRLARDYKHVSVSTSSQQQMIEPPTPMTLFEQVWVKKSHDLEQLNQTIRQDFMSLVEQAKQNLEEKNG